jgi:hypothetical protein
VGLDHRLTRFHKDVVEGNETPPLALLVLLIIMPVAAVLALVMRYRILVGWLVLRHMAQSASTWEEPGQKALSPNEWVTAG